LQDIVETPAALELHCDAPGFSPDDVSVEMNEGVITISGKRKEEKREEHDGKVRRRHSCCCCLCVLEARQYAPSSHCSDTVALFMCGINR
jgi:hypothetical protein